MGKHKKEHEEDRKKKKRRHRSPEEEEEEIEKKKVQKDKEKVSEEEGPSSSSSSSHHHHRHKDKGHSTSRDRDRPDKESEGWRREEGKRADSPHAYRPEKKKHRHASSSPRRTEGYRDRPPPHHHAHSPNRFLDREDRKYRDRDDDRNWKKEKRKNNMQPAPLPLHMNKKVIKHAEEIKQRKQLWQKGGEEKKVGTNWDGMLTAVSADESSLAKFRKMMGMKEGSTSKTDTPANAEEKEKHDSLLRGLDRQYDVARMSTHLQRGSGLGFSSTHMRF